MSRGTNDSGVQSERNTDGPDYFGYYKSEIAEILSKDNDFSIFEPKLDDNVGTDYGFKVSDSLFSNGIGTELSDFQRERLKAVLRQSAAVLSDEVDKMFGPVTKTREIVLRRREMHSSKSNGAEESEEGSGQARKKLKVASSSSSRGLPHQSGDGDMAQGTTDQEHPKVNDDVRILVEDDNPELDEILTSFSDELRKKLEYMEQELEELLDKVASKCRLMTLAEIKELQKMIKELKPENLERIAELVKRNKPEKERSSEEISVDLEKESNATLWRMYYYIEAVEKAKQLCS